MFWLFQVDSTAVEARLFPRASALAERLWSNPGQEWYQAQTRLLHHRARMVQRGVRADAVQPEWCEQNERQCYSEKDNVLINNKVGLRTNEEVETEESEEKEELASPVLEAQDDSE